jgi:peptidoglycan hydrolase CwlO-like protein
MKIYLLAIFLLYCLCPIKAQPEVKLTEQMRPFSKGSFNALVMELPGKLEALQTVKKEWTSYIKKYKGKVSFNKKNNECLSDDAKIKAMSENTVDIYCKIVPKDADHFEVVVWFNLGIIYLSSKEYSEGMAAAELIMKDFSKIVFVNLYKEKLKAAEKVLDELKNELNKSEKEAQNFENDIKDFESDISKIQKKITKTKESLNANKEKQTKQKSEINSQEKTVETSKRELDAAKQKRK